MKADTLYKKSVLGLIAVAIFGIAVFFNATQNQSAENNKKLSNADIAGIINPSETGKPAAPETPGLEGAKEEAMAIENSQKQSSSENLEDFLKNL